MNEWDKKFHPKIDYLINSNSKHHVIEAMQQEARNALVDIFDRFGVAGKKNSNRIEGLGLEDPPNYDAIPNVTEVDESGGSKVIYLVEKITGLGGNYKYTLICKNNRWILSKREFFNHDGRWVPFSF